MTGDQQCLLRAICGHPDEDTPRLVYADWLQERGEEGDFDRAEFIRLQIELARKDALACETLQPVSAAVGRDSPSPAKWCRCDLCRRLRRQRALASEHLGAWESEALTGVSARSRANTPATVNFRRGLVESVSITMNDFYPSAAKLFQFNPIQSVTLTGLEPRHAFGHMTWVAAGRWTRTRDWCGCEIPAALFVRLPGGRLRPRDVGGLGSFMRFYPTRNDALDALNTAAVLLGQERADDLDARMRLRAAASRCPD